MFGYGDCFVGAYCGAVFWLSYAQFFDECAKALAVFGQVNGVGRCAGDVEAPAFEVAREVERCLSAKLNDDAVGLFNIGYAEYVFGSEGFKVEFVRCVVVGGDGFGIGVDHDGLIAVFFEGIGGVATTIVEFDALSNAIGTAAQDHDFFAVGSNGFVVCLISRIVIGCVGFKFCRACIYGFEYGRNAEFFSQGANSPFVTLP